MRALFLLLLAAWPVSAQDAGPVSCRFLCLEKTAPPLINIAADGREIPCVLGTGNISPPVDCVPKGDSLHFSSTADRQPAAVARIPAGVNRAILIFVAAAKTPDSLPWRVFVIEDSLKNFPDGGAYVANFHQQDIRFVLGENKLMLKPAGSHGFGQPEKRDDFNMATVAFHFQQGETWRTASESRLRFVPGMRYLMFAYVDPVSKRPRISTFKDFVVRAPVP